MTSTDIAVGAVVVVLLLARYVAPWLVRRFTGWTSITVSMPCRLAEQVATEAERQGIGRDELVRQALRHELDLHQLIAEQT